MLNKKRNFTGALAFATALNFSSVAIANPTLENHLESPTESTTSRDQNGELEKNLGISFASYAHHSLLPPLNYSPKPFSALISPALSTEPFYSESSSDSSSSKKDSDYLWGGISCAVGILAIIAAVPGLKKEACAGYRSSDWHCKKSVDPLNATILGGGIALTISGAYLLFRE